MTPYSPALDLENPASSSTREAFLSGVQRGLLLRPRSLAPWMFYDVYGSLLFEHITQLPEYYLTRTGFKILKDSADAIIAAADDKSQSETSRLSWLPAMTEKASRQNSTVTS